MLAMMVVKTVPNTKDAATTGRRIGTRLGVKRATAERRLPPLSPISGDGSYERLHTFSSYSNWIIPDRFMVGRYPYIEPGIGRRCDTHEKGIRQLETILDSGIRSFICLQKELPEQTWMDQPVQGFHPYLPCCRSLVEDSIETMHFPIVDLSIPDAERLNDILHEMEEKLKDGAKMYMHCWGGRGRTGLVACCLLSKAFGISAEASLERIGRAYETRQDGNRSPETTEQIDFVHRFVSEYC